MAGLLSRLRGTAVCDPPRIASEQLAPGQEGDRIGGAGGGPLRARSRPRRRSPTLLHTVDGRTLSTRVDTALAASISLMADEKSEPGQQSGQAGPPMNPETLRCSFCGKAYAEVAAIVCGRTPSVSICNECVELCTEIIAEDRSGPARPA